MGCGHASVHTGAQESVFGHVQILLPGPVAAHRMELRDTNAVSGRFGFRGDITLKDGLGVRVQNFRRALPGSAPAYGSSAAAAEADLGREIFFVDIRVVDAVEDHEPMQEIVAALMGLSPDDLRIVIKAVQEMFITDNVKPGFL